MIWQKHSNLEGLHAFLGASKYHWLGYDVEKMETVYRNHLNLQRGTELHDFASRCIKLNQKLPKTNKTLNMFVNDAIGFKMQSEQILYYSDNCFGTADAICYRNGMLRIHDLKTGQTQAHMEQLEIYAALFCLEYGYNPKDISFELRIYQNDEIVFYQPEGEEINEIVKKIIEFDKLLAAIDKESEG